MKYIPLKVAMRLLTEYGELQGTSESLPTDTPTHGNCCTCQDCGHGHDECVCLHNEIVEKLHEYVVEIP